MLDDAQLLRFSRQILLPDWDIDAQLKLSQARVLMIGMGGLGCPAATGLARAGLGYLRIVDFDTVDESNLQRQTLFITQDLGQPKVTAAKRSLHAINPWLEIDAIQDRVSEQNLPSLLESVDLVLDGSDNFATRDAVNKACVGAKIPLLSAAAIGFEGQMTLIMPSKACYRCLFQDAPDDDARRCADTGVLATTTATIGAMQAHAALLFLGMGLTPLAERLLLWDGLNLNQRQIRYHKDPHCSVCASTNSI
ncbi:HesA/MoeB/ThiF family protein [Aquirhabdus parva]|uniref:HesA/MoeB/ThiF family protein n=1 Tax=Aquirhabdus parva TaxID=2283318 RepID=A0A345P5Z4_9GAMM|nr:HesA/MoeB/ThiF family protein [Aquirhabdus parva]AXI02703.1 HesA/MoeB/ThiF family protein [Aquirhabdus parva]